MGSLTRLSIGKVMGSNVDAEGDASNISGGIGTESDGVGPGVITGGGFNSQAVGSGSDLKGGLGSTHFGGKVARDTKFLEEGIVVFDTLENVGSVHGDSCLGRRRNKVTLSSSES